MNEVHQLSKPRFEALLYRRAPYAHMMAQELEWWSNEDETLIATVSLDLTDKDYSWIILGRDETGVFRGIDLNTSLPTLESAREEQNKRIEELSADGQATFPQNDNNAKKHEILKPCVPKKKLHYNFSQLLENPGYSPARELIKEISFAFKDLDGNFKKDFQTTGFDGRLWELFLYVYFYEQKYQIDDTKAVPDFIVANSLAKFGVEAVTVNPTTDLTPPLPQTPEEEAALCRDYMPIKWGSPLYSKLKKRYWEKPAIKDLPLVFAIHDFHGLGSMVWSLPALSDYLFGLRADSEGMDSPIESHKYGNKEIPSGFFNLPGSENISAVLASNEATLTKFNRMAKIAGFGDPNVQMIRIGAMLDYANVSMQPFQLETKEGVESENWSSGITIYHNPNATRPIDMRVFHTALNVFLENGQRSYFSTRQFHVARSQTQIIAYSD